MDNINIVMKYTDLFNEYGDDFRSLDWGSRESQQRRFDVLCRIGDLKNKSILDYGCGIADLKEYFNVNSIASEYTGYDITPSMIDFCQEKFPSNHFFCKDKDSIAYDEYDYILASGIFYLKVENSYKIVEEYLNCFFDKARIGCAVNFLSKMVSNSIDGVDEKLPDNEFYACPQKVLAIASKITNRFALHHDYADNDFTIFLYKSDYKR